MGHHAHRGDADHPPGTSTAGGHGAQPWRRAAAARSAARMASAHLVCARPDPGPDQHRRGLRPVLHFREPHPGRRPGHHHGAIAILGGLVRLAPAGPTAQACGCSTDRPGRARRGLDCGCIERPNESDGRAGGAGCVGLYGAWSGADQTVGTPIGAARLRELAAHRRRDHPLWAHPGVREKAADA